MYSIMSMPSNIINARNETSTYEDYNLSALTCKDDNICYSNSIYGLHVSDLSNFMDASKKDDAVDYVNATLCHAKKNYFFTPEKLYVECLNYLIKR